MNPAVAFITGAGSGLGRALANEYARHGHRVAVVALNLANAEQTVAALPNGELAHWAIEVDVSKPEAMKACADAVFAREGKVDVLINNAGVATAGNVFESNLEDWQWVWDINVMGVVYGCKLFGERMLAAKSGRIINIASFAALAGAPRLASYGVTKAGVYALSDGMRADLEGTGVTVSVACPAFFRTNLMDSARASDPKLLKTALRFMDVASETPESVAADIYRKSMRGDFLILPTKAEPMRWRLKRWLPNVYFKLLMRSTASARMKGKSK